MFEPANTVRFALLIPSVRHDFQVLSFKGTERISGLYAICITLVSESAAVDLESLLSQPAFLQFGPAGEGIHGHIEEVCVGESGTRLTRYHLKLVPFLHYLKFSRDQRIFQHLTSPQIIALVLKRHGIQSDAYRFHVGARPEREYCTQYAESDLAFIQRLCSEDGIAWHHQHSAERHLLVFTDDQTFFPTLGQTPYRPGSGLVEQEPVVHRFAMTFSTRTSSTTRRGYDLKRPRLRQESRFSADFQPALEDYRYPLRIENEQHGRQLARQALERHRADYQLAKGKSTQTLLRSGHFFHLTDHPREPCNDLWLLLKVKHEGKQPQVLEEAMPHARSGFTQGYRNRFSATPWDVTYRPPQVARKTAWASQTARVTGPAGEEIFCDEWGRVKVEFHWDRAGLGNERSSCWLRVSSGWAGDGFGAVTVPRVGMEVVVTYLEGDPDQPLITGCVANQSTLPPYPLPAHKTRTVLRSQSSPANGGYSELSIEDRAGQEKIYLRAQRDLQQQVGNDSHLDVGNDRRAIINGDDATYVTRSSHTRAGQTLVAEAGQQVHLKAGAHIVIEAGASITLKGGSEHLVIGPGGIFSSTTIELGGAPSPHQTHPASPLPAPAQRALMQASKALVPDFCPICEACENGLCLPQGTST
ncbi:type VI secretion system Vgr family protein [Pseudomonas sp. SDO528_S397]